MNACEICGCSRFDENDGYLFCISCGTQSQNYVDMEVETDGRNLNKTVLVDEIKKEKILELTSWEEYNYILVGLVNQLIQMGAKEEIKLTALQLWTEYLRIAEAAFFSKIELGLPRLPFAYKNKDATIMYDKKHVLRNIPKRKAPSKLSSARARRKRQKNIIELEYNSAASTVKGSSSASVPIQFTRNALEVLKTKMDETHIKFHENSDYRPKCHKQLARDINYKSKFEHTAARILVSIMYIALNKVDDKIQLGDMLRWFREGHLSVMNIERFFPDSYKLSRRMVEQLGQLAVMSHFRCRFNISTVLRFMNIRFLNRPDFTQLCRRYVIELGLPETVFKYAERLIRLYPPAMEKSITEFIPNYEGRAMAYIIFILKLIFGLNGVTEELLSDSAEEVNRIVCKDKLFSFRKWMHFIELRKIILSHYHFPTMLSTRATSSNQSHLYINHLNSIQNAMDAIDKKLINPSKVIEPLFEAMLKIANIHQAKDEKIKHKSIKFHPSLTPNSDYLICLLEKYKINVPKLLNENFQKSEFDFIKKNLLHRKLHENYGITLKFRKISKKLINMNKNLSKHILHRGSEDILKKFNCKKSWIEVIRKRKKLTTTDRILECVKQTNLKRTTDPNSKRQEAETKLISESAKFLINENNYGFGNESVEKNLSDSETDLNENNDFDTEPEFVYENNLETVDQLLPNRDLESNLRIFDNQSEDELSDDDNYYDEDEEIDFYLPNFYYWRRICHIGKNFGQYYEEVERELPKSFNWLVHECARITENKPHQLYSELLTVEAGFTCFMKPLTKNTTRVKFRKMVKNRKCSLKYMRYIDNLWHNW